MQQRDAALTTKKLLSAAEALFDEKGYYPVTLKEIGKKTGCSSALVAYYFGGKQGLYQAVINQQLGRIHFLQNETETTELSPLKRLTFFLTHLLRLQLTPPGHLNLVYKEVLSPSGLLDDSAWQQILAMEKYMDQLLRDAAKEGEIRPFKSEKELSYFSFTLTSITETLFLVKGWQMPLNPEGKPLDEVLDDLVQFTLAPIKLEKGA
ncbi:MAG: TetR/AcrR family transcriptional regulator [Acidaminococcus sp.]|jgi:AcrR family transcriptional regulator|nr:TetR/AcrR family transcriptional regulator [Acidaminococcus sp.]MCI2116750.1 TetR/AcrR family transcriptional regulator [Acidaminococcus sp.]